MAFDGSIALKEAAMQRTAEQEAAYQQLYLTCKKRLTQISLSSPEDLRHVLEVLNALASKEAKAA
jgi:hypothetical protein